MPHIRFTGIGGKLAIGAPYASLTRPKGQKNAGVFRYGDQRATEIARHPLQGPPAAPVSVHE